MSTPLCVLIVEDSEGEDVAVSAMKAGAHDYVMKDNLARLGLAVQRELHEAEVRLARRRAEEGQRKALAEALPATHALRESEERYRTLVTQAPSRKVSRKRAALLPSDCLKRIGQVNHNETFRCHSG
jgi:DNA-binding NtrC family response regulator